MCHPDMLEDTHMWTQTESGCQKFRRESSSRINGSLHFLFARRIDKLVYILDVIMVSGDKFATSCASIRYMCR